MQLSQVVVHSRERKDSLRQCPKYAPGSKLNAQSERDKRDPVRGQLQKVAEQEMAKAGASAAKLVPLKDAF